MSLATTIYLRLTARHTKTFDLMTPTGFLEKIVDKAIADGTGAAQADLSWHDIRTLAATSNDDLDLSGVLTDIFGATVAMAKLKMLYIENPTTNDGNLEIGAAGTNPIVGFFADISDKITIKPGGFVLIASPTVAGYAVAAGSADVLRVRNAGSVSVNYTIIAIGTSA
jgi:hypothetical protein